MRIKGITEQDLREAVAAVSGFMYNGNIIFKREPERKGNFLHFTLTVHDSSDGGGRRSYTGRRVAAACWHAHRDVMREIFRIAPDALLVTALARYEGIDGFEAEFPATGLINIGSQFQPLDMRNACDC